MLTNPEAFTEGEEVKQIIDTKAEESKAEENKWDHQRESKKLGEKPLLISPDKPETDYNYRSSNVERRA